MTTNTGRRSYYLYWIAVVVVVGAGVGLFWPRAKDREELREGTSGQAPLVSVRPVTLYFADPQAESLIPEEREIGFGSNLEESVEMTIQALVEGPEQEGASSVLPREARLLQAFFADEDATLYLDFNTAMMTQHPGGSAAEYSTLSAIVRTLGANFPEVKRVQILVDGQPVESLGGHFDTSRPLEIVTWQ